MSIEGTLAQVYSARWRNDELPAFVIIHTHHSDARCDSTCLMFERMEGVPDRYFRR